MSESEQDNKKWKARVTEKLLTVLNRADELGGELRDQIQDKLATDPRYASARRAIGKLFGRRDEPSRPAPAAPARPAAAGVASPPAPAEKASPPAAENASPGAAAEKSAPAAGEKSPAAASKSKGFGDAAIKAQIYGKRSCPWTGRAITLLERHKIDFDFIDLEEPEHEAKLAPLTLETKQNTVPYVYLRGRFVGGFNALSEIERLGQLEPALMSKDELARAPAHVRAVEIVPRPNTDEVAPAEAGPPPGEPG